MTRLLHISDLHFHESLTGDAGTYRHSLACLKGIETLVSEQKPTHLVVSGDITNLGDKISLERAYQWIHDQIYSDGEYYGLHSTTSKLATLVVPGNHDAFNASTTGSEFKRWQSSLSNFYSVFHQYQWADDQNGVSYRWSDDGDVAVFFCMVDSCYLGDAETEHLDDTLTLDRVAKGRLSKKQSGSILSLFDRGSSGTLVDDSKTPIPGGKFLSSLKILVMHHYLFEPANTRAEPLLQVQQKRNVFQNLAMSDFDILLCGHKHIADVQVSSYADNFDTRGHLRLAFNYVRRILGIKSLPLQTDEDGRKLSRIFRLVFAFLVMSKGRGKPLTEKSSQEIVSVLERSLANPMVLKEELLKHLGGINELHQPGLFDATEIAELHGKIKEKFDQNERKLLNDAANQLRGLLSHLSGRPFAHIMSASSAKASEISSRGRAVNVYEVTKSSANAGYLFNISRYSWDSKKHRFELAFQQQVPFPANRILGTRSEI